MSPGHGVRNEPRSDGPLHIAEQGCLWVGLQRVEMAEGTVARGQMFVHFQVPAERRTDVPVVMVPGGGGHGIDYLGTPDGRPGWATHLVRAGLAVYVVDLPGAGRSPALAAPRRPAERAPTFERVEGRFTAPRSVGSYPQAAAHSQWPGTGSVGDPALDAFVAGQEPASELEPAQADMRRCGVELLERIGPSVLLTHSLGGAFGWVVADARPDLVRAIVAVEPVGPPFAQLPGGVGGLTWGVTAVPLTFDPPVGSPADLSTRSLPAPGPGLHPGVVQADPVRRLVNLRAPILVVTGEASWMAQYDHATVAFLAQAGADVEHLRLEDRGIRGNGHLMMLERNSAEIADVLVDWIATHAGVQDA